MRRCSLTISLLCVVACIGTARAESPVSQEKSACEHQEQRQGTSAPASALKCTVKVIFQSRIRRRKDDEAVEMTAGSPPLQTDDTETPGPKSLEVSLIMQGEAGTGEHRIGLPIVELNYGLGDSLQFNYAIPYVFVKQAALGATAQESITANGVGDSNLGLKYRFYDNTDTGVSFAIAPEVQFRTPGANRRVSEVRTTTVLPILMTREFAHESFTANAGVRLSAGQQRYFGSFAVGKRLSNNVALLGEIVGNDLNAADEKRVLLNFGLRRKISGTQSISGALGRDIFVGGDSHKLVYFSLAYQKIFGK